SDGEVRLVILVDIKETKTIRKDKNFKSKHRNLMIQFGNAKGKRRDGIDSDADETSDAEMYKAVRSAVQVDDWVGPIVVNLEVWHIVNGRPQQRGSQIVRFHYYS